MCNNNLYNNGITKLFVTALKQGYSEFHVVPVPSFTYSNVVVDNHGYHYLVDIKIVNREDLFSETCIEFIDEYMINEI